MLPPLKVIISGVDQFSKTFEEMKHKMKKISEGTKVVGEAMTVGITAPLVDMGYEAIKASTNLNEAMANVQSLGVTSDRTVELKKNVQELAEETGQSSVQISKGLYQMISAFGESADTAKIMEINVKAAAAGLSTVEDATALTSAVTKGYGDTSTTAMQKVADLAFQTVALGQTTFPQLAQAIGKVTPIASALGVSQEELFSVFATGTGVVGNADEVSTAYRMILLELMKPTGKMAILMKHFGIASGEAMIKQKGLAGSLQFIAEKAAEVHMPLGNLITSARALPLALALTGPQAEVWKDKLDKMGQSGGAMSKAFEAQTNGINAAGFAFKQFRANFDTVLEHIGDVLAPALSKMLKAFEPFVDILRELSPAAIATITVIAGMVAAIGPLLIIGVHVVGAIGAILEAVSAAGGAFALLSNPIGWVIAGILLLAGAVTFVVTHWESKWAKLVAALFPVTGIIALIIKKWEKIAPLARIALAPWIISFQLLWTVVKWVFGKIADFIQVITVPLEHFVDTILDTLLKIANMALPDWVKKRIGFEMPGSGTPSAEAVAASVVGAHEGQNKVKGTITVKGIPKGSTFTMEEGDVNPETDNGEIMGGD